MIAALDSSLDRPTPAQAAAARAAGVRAWGGYLATRVDVGLEAPWSRADFQVVQQAGLRALAFCSGWDDPVALRALAEAWGVLLVLDDEDGIRPLTRPDWRPAFLQASGAGLYCVVVRHTIAAPFRILAAYPGVDPGAVWPAALLPPPGPLGWQWQGTHSEFGLSVDRSWLDDWFLGGDDVLDPSDPVVVALMQKIEAGPWSLAEGANPPANQGEVLSILRGLNDYFGRVNPLGALTAELDRVQAELQALAAQGVPPAALQPLQDAIGRLGAHLGVGTA